MIARRALLGVALAGACASLEPTESLTVTTRFPHAVAAARAHEVEVFALALDAEAVSPCPLLLSGVLDPETSDLEVEAAHARVLERPDGTAPTSVGFVFELRAGSKALFATARDDAGELTLRGCATSAATPGAVVDVELHAPR